MVIKCCKSCVPPTRYPGCHDKCERYKVEKAEYEKQKEYTKAHKTVILTNYDFNKTDYMSSKCHKGKN